MTTMVERAIQHMQSDTDANAAWTLATLRMAAGVSLRSQYKLAEQLKEDARVVDMGGNVFSLQ